MRLNTLGGRERAGLTLILHFFNKMYHTQYLHNSPHSPKKISGRCCTAYSEARKSITPMPLLISQTTPLISHILSLTASFLSLSLLESCDQQRPERCADVLLTQVEAPLEDAALIEWRPSRVAAPLEHVPAPERRPSHHIDSESGPEPIRLAV